MKSTTPQTVFARSGDRAGAFAVATSQPPAKDQPKTLRTQLVFRDDLGAIVRSWPLQQAKCTLGSSQRCEVHVELPGIEPLNALIVLGIRQAFVRALVPNLSRDGVLVNELLLTEQQNYFELAGHRFEIQREPRKLSPKEASSSRIKFSASRPFDLSGPSTQSGYARASDRELPAELSDSPWLKSLIERTFEPLERQLESLLLPMTEIHSQVIETQKARDTETIAEKQRQAELAHELTAVVAKQSATMESLGERLRDVNQQLSAIERMIAEDEELECKAKDSIAVEVSVQRSAIEQLQSGMVAVTESLNQLHDRQQAEQTEQNLWKESVREQLSELSDGVGQLKVISSQRTDSEVLNTVQSLQQNQQVLQEELQRWQYGLHEHLENLERQVSELSEVVHSLPKSSSEVSERLDGSDSPTDRLPIDSLSTVGHSGTTPSGQIREFGDSQVFPTWAGETPATSESLQPINDYLGTFSSDREQAESRDWLEQWTAVPSDSGASTTHWSNHGQSMLEAEEAWEVSEKLPEAFTNEEPTKLTNDPDSTDWSHSVQAYSGSSTLDATSNPAATAGTQAGDCRESGSDDREFFFGAESFQTSLQPTHQPEKFSMQEETSFQADQNPSTDPGDSESAPLPSWWTEDGEVESVAQHSPQRGAFQGDPNQTFIPGEAVREAELIESDSTLEGSAIEGLAKDEPKLEEPAEQSVEEYMNSLLARMRGEAPPAKATSTQPHATPRGSIPSSPAQHSQPARTGSASPTQVAGSERAEPPGTVEVMDLDNYVSMTKAPEKSNSINAMRELANSSARLAVHNSARKRFLSASLLKLAVCMIGLTVAGALFAVNGFALNVGLIATLASLLVAAIWGYDAIVGLKPLLQTSLVLAPPNAAELADGDD